MLTVVSLLFTISEVSLSSSEQAVKAAVTVMAIARMALFIMNVFIVRIIIFKL